MNYSDNLLRSTSSPEHHLAHVPSKETEVVLEANEDDEDEVHNRDELKNYTMKMKEENKDMRSKNGSISRHKSDKDIHIDFL